MPAVKNCLKFSSVMCCGSNIASFGFYITFLLSHMEEVFFFLIDFLFVTEDASK